MNLQALTDIPPWQWPDDTAGKLLGILRDRQVDPDERLLASRLAGDVVVIDDELAAALLAIVESGAEEAKLRATAAIALGPILDLVDAEGFDGDGGVPISESTYEGLRDALRRLYQEADVPEEVRRSVLEASVRAPQDWHVGAVRAAYAANDDLWERTAVFAMRFVRGFDDAILEALGSDDEELYYQAICAAGTWGLDAAWPHVVALLESSTTDKDLLLAAIEAAANIRPHEVHLVFANLTDSDDEEIVDALDEAVMMAAAFAQAEADPE